MDESSKNETIIYSKDQIKLTVEVTQASATAELEVKATYTGADGKVTTDPQIVNKYDTIRIHAVKCSRDYDENGNIKLGEPLAGAHYGLWMYNPNGNDIYMGVQESDEHGNLWYSIPTIEGVAYYFKEEEPPPAGHLVDPYPTDFFTLRINDNKFELEYESDFASRDAFLQDVATRTNKTQG